MSHHGRRVLGLIWSMEYKTLSKQIDLCWPTCLNFGRMLFMNVVSCWETQSTRSNIRQHCTTVPSFAVVTAHEIDGPASVA